MQTTWATRPCGNSRYYLDSEMDCSVRITLPPGEMKEDVADWIQNDGPDAVAARVTELLQDYAPDAGDAVEPPAPPREPVKGDIRQNDHYQLLGLAGDAIAIRLVKEGRVLTQTRESLTQPSTLISLAPLDWWYRLADADTLSAATARRIGDAMLREAADLGQVDLSKRAGRGASLVNDTVVYHLGDRLLLNGEEINLDGHDGRIWLAEPRIELGAEASVAEMRAIAEAVLDYRWATPDDGKRLLGWIVAAIVGGALEWRPHVMFTAESSTGKSWILKHVVQRLMGPLMMRIADATPAALARLTDVSSLPIAIDEAEPTKDWVVALLELLRISAGAEGKRVRADNTTGGVTTQEPRFAALLSNTAQPELQRADETRLTHIRLGKAVEDWPAVRDGIQAAMKHARRGPLSNHPARAGDSGEDRARIRRDANSRHGNP